MQPDAKRKLYKFSGPTEYALQNLENGMIFCQHYSAYNDPFEFWANIYEGVPDAQKEPERLIAAKQAWGAEWMADEDEYLVEYFSTCLDEQPSFRHWRDITRIACFGSEPDNLLMWSHYADGLRGLCLVLDETELLEASPKSTVAVNVAYQEDPPTADAFVYAIANDQMDFHLMSIDEAKSRFKHLGEKDPYLADYRSVAGDSYLSMIEILQRLLATKPVEWKYETERRLLVRAPASNTEPVFHAFPRTALREVLIGERMLGSYRERLGAILIEQYPRVPLRKVKRSSDTYRLLVE